MNQSALDGGRGGGGRAVGRQVEAGVLSSTGKLELFDRYKIGYADSNVVIDKRGFRVGPGKAGLDTLFIHKPTYISPTF